MKFIRILPVMILLVSGLVAKSVIAGDAQNKNEIAQVKKPATHVTKHSPAARAEIEKEIKRIEGLVKAKPTVRGWLLIGDAYMQLKKHKEAAGAYNDAYFLSDSDPKIRDKVRKALYVAFLEKEGGDK
jgi:cytochrome c-type biogenesis protein CcmH/NrfG